MDRTQQQIYQPWRIGAFPKGFNDLQSIRGSYNFLELDLVFHELQETITVEFDYAGVALYRTIDEGKRLKQLHYLFQQQLLPLDETIYIVSNSDLVDELIVECCGILDKTSVTHYFIATANDCIDVVTYAGVEPELKRSKPKPVAAKVTVADEKLIVDLVDGRSLIIPLDWYPRLSDASVEEQQNWQLLGGGYAIEWPDLDEHIGIEGLLAGRRSGESPQSFDRWLAARNPTSSSRE